MTTDQCRDAADHRDEKPHPRQQQAQRCGRRYPTTAANGQCGAALTNCGRAPTMVTIFIVVVFVPLGYCGYGARAGLRVERMVLLL